MNRRMRRHRERRGRHRIHEACSPACELIDGRGSEVRSPHDGDVVSPQSVHRDEDDRRIRLQGGLATVLPTAHGEAVHEDQEQSRGQGNWKPTGPRRKTLGGLLRPATNPVAGIQAHHAHHTERHGEEGEGRGQPTR